MVFQSDSELSSFCERVHMPQTDYKLVALDLDGTVLDSRGNVADDFPDLIASLAQRKVRTVVCTGRRWRTTVEALEQIGEADPVVVCCGGALIKDGQTHETLHKTPLRPGLARQCVGLFRSANLVPLLLYDRPLAERELLVSAGERQLARELMYIRRNLHTVDFYRGELPDLEEKPLEVYTVDTRGIVQPAEVRAREEFQEKGFVTGLHQPGYPESQWVLQVHNRSATKWNALCWLMDNWGISPREVVAIGDDVNDVPMLRGAGLSFAMANAVPEARAAADELTDSNDESGVSRALHSVFS